MQDHYQEEISAKENLGRSLNKALGEADMLRVRYEKEGVAKAEEPEMAKMMQERLSGADSSAGQLKTKQFDRVAGEWKSKVDSIGMDLDSAQKETRNASSELFRV